MVKVRVGADGCVMYAVVDLVFCVFSVKDDDSAWSDLFSEEFSAVVLEHLFGDFEAEV